MFLKPKEKKQSLLKAVKLMLENILKKYQIQLQEVLQKEVDSFGPKNSLRDAIEYALLTEGKRFRPAIVLMIAESLGVQESPVDAALAIEYFHTASLIADDLPCMDNDSLRRNRPTLHLVFGETIALLASYALISAGYQKIASASKKMGEKGPLICQLALENAGYNTGVFGATGGQYLDLYLEEPNGESVMEIIEKKTGTLFEISSVFGWLFGGGEIEALPLIKKIANHFGKAFQILDDFADIDQDRAKKCPINYPLAVGEKKGLEILTQELNALFKYLEALPHLQNSSIYELALLLKEQSFKLQQALLPSLL